LPSDVVKDMLTQVARMRVNAGWELRLPTDDAFLAQFPEIAARQKLLLEQRYASYEATPQAHWAQSLAVLTVWF